MLHNHSMKVYSDPQLKKYRQSRKQLILKIYQDAEEPLADHDVLDILFKGATDMRLVSPRITGLKDDGKIIEVGSKKNRFGRLVRTAVIAPPSNQMSMF